MAANSGVTIIIAGKDDTGAAFKAIEDSLRRVRDRSKETESALAELGENLIKAASGREALEILLKTDVAVVLMDVSMPEMDGFEMAEIIRQHPRFQKTAIIFISGVHLTDLDKLKGYQRGAVDYISVPVVPEVLRAKVSVFAALPPLLMM